MSAGPPVGEEARRGRPASDEARRGRLVVVHPTANILAEAVAARLLIRILDVQSVRRPVHLVLTGGGVGTATLAAVARHPLRDAVDWAGVHLWWGDERFLPTGHPDRNETQARAALLDRLTALEAAQVHPIPARDAADGGTATGGTAGGRGAGGRGAGGRGAGGRGAGGGGDPAATPQAAATDNPATPQAAADAYAATLAAHAVRPDAVPVFDVVLLGVGPDGHIASLFPGLPGADAAEPVIGVLDSPKPPPERVSLTLGALGVAREVWLLAAGVEKADAVARALAESAGAGPNAAPTTRPAGAAAGPAALPAGRVAGTQRTLWLLDAAAARGSR